MIFGSDMDSCCVQCAMQTFDHDNNITAHDDSGPQVGVGNTTVEHSGVNSHTNTH